MRDVYVPSHVKLSAASCTVATRLHCPWDSPGKNTGVGCHVLLQGIFLTQGSDPCLLHWQADSLPLSHLGDNNNTDLIGVVRFNLVKGWTHKGFIISSICKSLQGFFVPEAGRLYRHTSFYCTLQTLCRFTSWHFVTTLRCQIMVSIFSNKVLISVLGINKCIHHSFTCSAVAHLLDYCM